MNDKPLTPLGQTAEPLRVEERVPLGQGAGEPGSDSARGGSEGALLAATARRLGLLPAQIESLVIERHAVDARKGRPLCHVYLVSVTLRDRSSESVAPAATLSWPEVPALPQLPAGW